ncbi:PepSY domain-containing protein [Grimontia sp. NTOU-MAR1]|uniref:PepSY domain-containing protein n=1 Tax=Grimontia sp. NTOU-MAR1 TaxID=3111011 RepID=UPI002DB5FF25|nr:PepSY domain-containing protein [Grimontia sp. NTOU-MAR1]WRV99170.1 PepSY domain-containing protein [Grimontia sp. NTOU-MAR1]
MKKLMLCSTLIALGVVSLPNYAASNAEIINQEEAIKAALGALNIEVLGIRHDKPDTQWDVFVKKDDKAYEIEVDALTGKIVAAEEERLAEIKAELSGDLSHEGVIGDVDK